MRPWASRSASHMASFTSVLRPGTAFTCIALASTSSKSPARTAQTGFQYTPVASMATHVTPWLVSHADSRSSSAVVRGEGLDQADHTAGLGQAHAGHDGVPVNVEPGATH